MPYVHKCESLSHIGGTPVFFLKESCILLNFHKHFELNFCHVKN